MTGPPARWGAAFAIAIFLVGLTVYVTVGRDQLLVHPPPAEPDPALYRALFFLPLFSVEVITLALLVACPGTRITRWTLWLLSGMFAFFAAWAVLGFGYPSTPAFVTANAVSKLLAFAATLSLFLPTPRVRGARSAPAEQVHDLMAPKDSGA